MDNDDDSSESQQQHEDQSEEDSSSSYLIVFSLFVFFLGLKVWRKTWLREKVFILLKMGLLGDIYVPWWKRNTWSKDSYMWSRRRWSQCLTDYRNGQRRKRKQTRRERRWYQKELELDVAEICLEGAIEDMEKKTEIGWTEEDEDVVVPV